MVIASDCVCAHCLRATDPPRSERHAAAAEGAACAVTVQCRPPVVRCQRCYGVVYCDVACQHAHWTAHQQVCTDPSLKSTARSAALFLGTGGRGAGVLEIMVRSGWAADVYRCQDLCRDARSNPNVTPLAEVPRGPKHRTRLMYWCGAGGDIVRLRWALSGDRGIDVDRRDYLGCTALTWATKNGRLDIVYELVGRGATVGLRASNGGTPLHAAAWNGHAAVVRALVTRGADPNARTTVGETPLMLSSAQNQPAAVAALLECGAAVNELDGEGRSALMMAAYRGHVPAVCALLAAPGIVLDLPDATNGRTALWWALQKRHTDVAAVLVAAGASR